MARSENRQALMRIATVLTALAELAERASARPWPVLWLVLCILRPAEAIARRFAVEVSQSAALPNAFCEPAPVVDRGATGAAAARAEASWLAAQFRLLAAVLGCLAAADAPECGQPGLRRGAARNIPAREVIGGRAPTFADTS